MRKNPIGVRIPENIIAEIDKITPLIASSRHQCILMLIEWGLKFSPDLEEKLDVLINDLHEMTDDRDQIAYDLLDCRSKLTMSEECLKNIMKENNENKLKLAEYSTPKCQDSFLTILIL